MTQKKLTETPENILLQTIDPEEIADPSVRQTIEILLNLIEQLKSEVKELREGLQRLQDENNRLKGEQGKPEIKAKLGRENNHSSEKERKTAKSHAKGQKNESIKIDRQEIIKYPQDKLPIDAQFKGYEEVIVQDIKLSTDNVLFRKEKYYSPLLGKTYLAELPGGYEGEFGPGIKALVISLYYGSNITQGKLLDFLGDIGISISAGYLSNLLIKNHEDFQTEKNEVYSEGIASSPWQHFDQTSARVSGVNYTTNIICNPLYTVYFTTLKKDRLTVLKGLQNTNVLEVILNQFTYELLDTFQIPQKFQSSLKLLPQEKVLNEVEFNTLLDNYLPKLGPQQRTRVLEAAAIAYYRQQTVWPVVQVLVCDDAPQFKLLSADLALCWVHEGRHYKKLSPLVGHHQRLLDQFLTIFLGLLPKITSLSGCPKLAGCDETAF